MCVNCSATKKKYWVFGCSTFFLLFALLIGLLWPIIATSILHKVKCEKKNHKNLLRSKIANLNICVISFRFHSNAFYIKNLELREGSLNYDNWIKTPIPMYLKITMFNWTNPHDIHNASVKPHFEEVGPYIFLERHDRVALKWSPDGNRVSYYQTRVWHFMPEMSNGSLSDEITNINVMTSVSGLGESQFKANQPELSPKSHFSQ